MTLHSFRSLGFSKVIEPNIQFLTWSEFTRQSRRFDLLVVVGFFFLYCLLVDFTSLKLLKPVFLTCIFLYPDIFHSFSANTGPLLVHYWHFPFFAVWLRPPWCSLKPGEHLSAIETWLLWVSVCTFEIKQGYSWDHLVSEFNPLLLLEKEKLPLSQIPHPACESQQPDFAASSSLCVLLSLPFPRQSNADQVAFQVGGGLSALEQILQVISAASTPTAVPRIPLKWVPSPNASASISHANTQIKMHICL